MTRRDVDDISMLMTRINKVILQLFVDSWVQNACLCNPPKWTVLTSVDCPHCLPGDSYQHRNILYHHILHGLRNRVTHNLMEDTKVMFYKAVCTITLHERGVGYISMSSEDHKDCPPKLSQTDFLYPITAPTPVSSWKPTQL